MELLLEEDSDSGTELLLEDWLVFVMEGLLQELLEEVFVPLTEEELFEPLIEELVFVTDKLEEEVFVTETELLEEEVFVTD